MHVVRKSVRTGPGVTRHTARVETEEQTQFGSRECWQSWLGLLRALADQPDISICGAHRPHKMVINHNGGQWVADCEATVNE